MKSDIEIARSTELMKIKQIAQNYGIPLWKLYGKSLGSID